MVYYPPFLDGREEGRDEHQRLPCNGTLTVGMSIPPRTAQLPL